MAYRLDAGIAREAGLSAYSDAIAINPAMRAPAEGSASLVLQQTAQTQPLTSFYADLAGTSALKSVSMLGVTAGGPRPVAFDRGDNTPPIGGDDIPDDTSSTVSLDANGGDSLHSALDHPADRDFIQVNLTAGVIYEFTLTPDDPDGTTGPDLLMNVRDADGNVIPNYGDLDGGSAGATESHNVTVSESGVYYIDVGAYLDASIGGYTLDVGIDPSPPTNFGTPLGAIDWGGTERRVDTDGVEDGEGNDVIQFYFAQTGETYESNLAGVVVAQDWQDFEKEAAYTAFGQYENIVNVRYEEVGTAEEADFVMISHAFEPNILGSMSPPGEAQEGQGEFNNVGVGWDEEGLVQGGFGFITLIHEMGHGHGLAHPHDNGGGSEVMHGVEEEGALDYSTGDYGLNNGVYTTMSYNDGWDKDGPNGAAPENGYGYQGTLMAFDVAVLQQKYGANMTYKTGNDTYTLPDVNQAGTFYSCIWDAGGNDTIKGSKTLDNTINLNAATLQYEEGGGGWVSYADGIFGGYTIANGVTIENAVGGKGNDAITGNDAANELGGAAGNDTIVAGAGADSIEGGKGIDTITGGDDLDTFVFDDHSTKRHKSDVITDLDNNETVDLSGIDANTAIGGDQGFTLVDHLGGNAGELAVKYDSGADITRFVMDIDGDGRADMAILANGNHAGYDAFGF